MTPNIDLNDTLFERARRVIPGGVNSPVRAFKAVGGTPRFIKRAQGAYFWDANGTRYIDYIGSWGPMILGHGHPAIVQAVQSAAVEGFSFGAPTEREIELAEEILRLVPSIDLLRPVAPRASRMAVMAASVPELTRRTMSMLGTRCKISSTSSISRSVGAPNEKPSKQLAARPASSNALKVRTFGMPTTSVTSTTSAPGGR